MYMTRKGEKHEVAGVQPTVGSAAPDFSLKDIEDKNWQLGEFLDKPLIISVVPDIDTRVCSLQTKRFNQEAAAEKELNFVTISNNTKEEQANWCAAEGVDMTLLHDEDAIFGTAYGLFIPDTGRLLRSIFVVATDGTISYQELVTEQSDEPDYQKALAAAKALI